MTPTTVLTAAGGKTVSFSQTMRFFLNRLPARSRDIVEIRFGIAESEPKTLEEIGRTYGITRERVRQVIGSVLGFIAGEHADPMIVRITTLVQSTLQEKSGIMETEELLKILTRENKNERGALLAFIESLSMLKAEKETDEMEGAYRLESFDLARWKEIKDATKAVLEKTSEPLAADVFYRYFQIKNPEISEKIFFDFLAVAKDVKQNVFGKWGLASSSDIRPRGTREKAHLILKTVGKPLHFREIAVLIDKHGLQGKKEKSHPQTVHNELIKDKRFVLVGRGIYALSEWGYKKGTVKDVVMDILKTSDKPLSREEILAEVMKRRQVKKSTVIINLNTSFTRVGKNAYTVKE